MKGRIHPVLINRRNAFGQMGIFTIIKQDQRAAGGNEDATCLIM